MKSIPPILTTVIASLAVISCNSSPSTQEFLPSPEDLEVPRLVTIAPPEAVNSASIGPSTIDIIGSCVSLRANNGDVFTAVFAEGSVEWVERGVRFRLSTFSGADEYNIGDKANFNGSEFHNAPKHDFVVPPKEDCPSDLFFAG